MDLVQFRKDLKCVVEEYKSPFVADECLVTLLGQQNHDPFRKLWVQKALLNTILQNQKEDRAHVIP